MGNVTEFKKKSKDAEDGLTAVSYTDNDGDLGLSTLDKRLEIVRLNDSEFMVITPDGSEVYNRYNLAEFLWVASVFLDSEELYRPAVDLVGCDY